MDTLLWQVVQDGRPLRRGLTRSDAERYADQLARGYERHRASDKRRVAEFDIRLDTTLMAEHDANYTLFKEGR